MWTPRGTIVLLSSDEDEPAGSAMRARRLVVDSSPSSESSSPERAPSAARSSPVPAARSAVRRGRIVLEDDDASDDEPTLAAEACTPLAAVSGAARHVQGLASRRRRAVLDSPSSSDGSLPTPPRLGSARAPISSARGRRVVLDSPPSGGSPSSADDSAAATPPPHGGSSTPRRASARVIVLLSSDDDGDDDDDDDDDPDDADSGPERAEGAAAERVGSSPRTAVIGQGGGGLGAISLVDGTPTSHRRPAPPWRPHRQETSGVAHALPVRPQLPAPAPPGQAGACADEPIELSSDSGSDEPAEEPPRRRVGSARPAGARRWPCASPPSGGSSSGSDDSALPGSPPRPRRRAPGGGRPEGDRGAGGGVLAAVGGAGANIGSAPATPARGKKLAPPSDPATTPAPRARPAAPPLSARARAAQRRALTESLRPEFERLNRAAFEGRLPLDLPLAWSNTLRRTAGITKLWTARGADGGRRARIELATKVVDSPERLESTLLHEMCHAAAWLLDGCLRPPHGAPFWEWARRAMRRLPGVQVTTCHAYEIHCRHRFRCEGCRKEYGRHSKSIDPAKHACSLCAGRLVYLGAFELDGTPVRARAPTAFSRFVGERMGAAKQRAGPGASHAQVMALLSAEWHELKASGGVLGSAGSGGALVAGGSDDRQRHGNVGNSNAAGDEAQRAGGGSSGPGAPTSAASSVLDAMLAELQI